MTASGTIFFYCPFSQLLLLNCLTMPSKKINEGDDISFEIPIPKKTSLRPYKYKLDIIYQDKDLIVIDKPAGISMHPGPGNYDNTVVNALMSYDKINYVFGLKLTKFNFFSLLKYFQMQTIYRTLFFLFFISVTSTASACHEGDFESVYKGHHIWGKSVGLFQFTENSTISVSTTSSCDLYTAFLESEYNFIQEQVAYGHGQHLDALRMIYGCNPKVKNEFSKKLRLNYTILFSEQRNTDELKKGIEKLINSNTLLNTYCRSA